MNVNFGPFGQRKSSGGVNWVLVPHDTCVLEQNTGPQLFCPLNGSKVGGSICHKINLKELNTLYHSEKGFASVFLAWLTADYAASP